MQPDIEAMESIAPFARTYTIIELQEKGREFMTPFSVRAGAASIVQRRARRLLRRVQSMKGSLLAGS